MPSSRRSARTDTPDVPGVGAETILAALRDAGVPCRPTSSPQTLRLERRDREVVRRRAPGACSATGEVLINRKGELWSPRSSTSSRGTVAGPPGRLRLPRARRGRRRRVPEPARDAQGAARRPRRRARRPAPTGAVGPKARSSRCWSGPTARSSAACYEERGIWFVVAENRRINQDSLVPPDERGKAKPGEVVVVEIVEQPSPHREASRRINRGAGPPTDPGMEIEIALRKHELPFEFSREAARAGEAPARRRACRPIARARRHAPRCRSSPSTARPRRTSTTPCAARRKGRGFRLVVAIADVSHYVRDGDALDGDARERGNSVYFPRRVIPMLPEELSNELCSLKPDVDRLLHGLRHGDRRDAARSRSYRFYPAVMHCRRASPTTRSGTGSSEPGSAHGEGRARPAAASREPLRALQGAGQGAREARRDRLRHRRVGSSISTTAARSSASSRRRATTRTS